MKIAEIELHVIRIPLRQPFRHTLATRRMAENVVVGLKTEEGIVGYGESVPREYVTGESIESVLGSIVNIFAPILWKQEWGGRNQLLPFLQGLARDLREEKGIAEEKVLAARCAVELALLDAAGRVFGCPATEFLGWKSSGQPVTYSGVISSEETPKAVRKAWLMRLYGFRAVKLKVGDVDDDQKIERVRRVLGPRIDLRLDANGAWKAEQAIQKINAWKKFGITAVEQPVPKEDLEGMARVTAQTDVDIVADESLCSLNDAQRLAEQKGCDIFNIRLSKCGGLVNAGEMIRMAQVRGLGVQLGCQVGETAILSSAGRLFAQAWPSLRYLEGSYERFLLKEDLSRNRIRFTYGGKAEPIVGPGLGIEMNEKTLNRLTQVKMVLKRS